MALFLRDLLVIFVVALLISFLIKTFLIRSFYIPSGSMETTLLVNDRIIVNQLEPKLIPIDR
ncbi:MAG: signal peptidase, partial [Cryobacterium sp.]|nr:signal peptidase [Cryobacterium sp.]